jgi:hypothetical protein
MSGIEIELASEKTRKWKTLTIGAVIGALAGIAAAYLLVKRAENEGGTPKLSAGEGVKLGALVLGLLRQVSQLGS